MAHTRYFQNIWFIGFIIWPLCSKILVNKLSWLLCYEAYLSVWMCSIPNANSIQGRSRQTSNKLARKYNTCFISFFFSFFFGGDWLGVYPFGISQWRKKEKKKKKWKRLRLFKWKVIKENIAYIIKTIIEYSTSDVSIIIWSFLQTKFLILLFFVCVSGEYTKFWPWLFTVSFVFCYGNESLSGKRHMRSSASQISAFCVSAATVESLSIIFKLTM